MKIAKSDIRKKVLKNRDALSECKIKAHSMAITRKVNDIIMKKRPQNVLIYMDFRTEVRTQGIVRFLYENKINVFVPRVNFDTNELEIVPLLDDTKLELSKYGILEPTKDYAPVLEKIIDLIIVPGSAFTPSLQRLGYGGGYYDKLFARVGDVFKLAICFDLQIVGSLPVEATDIPVDAVVTENRVFAKDFE